MANNARSCGIWRATCSGSKSFMLWKFSSTAISDALSVKVLFTASFKPGENSPRTLSKLFLLMSIFCLPESGRHGVLLAAQGQVGDPGLAALILPRSGLG